MGPMNCLMYLARPLLAAFLCLGAVAQEPARLVTKPDRVLAAPCDDCMPGVINFAKVDRALWRGAQPTAEGFKALEKAGAKTIVSFRHDHDDLDALKGTTLRYLRFPSRAWSAKKKDLLLFLKVMEDPANWPVYIHCAQGRDRTGYNAAAYRLVIQGWETEPVLQEMATFHFNKIWIANPGFLRKLDVARMREELKTLPAPKLLVASEAPSENQR